MWMVEGMVWNTDVPTGMLGWGGGTELQVSQSHGHIIFSVSERFKCRVALEWIVLAILVEVFFSSFAVPPIMSHLFFPYPLSMVAPWLQILRVSYSTHQCSGGEARRHCFLSPLFHSKYTFLGPVMWNYLCLSLCFVYYSRQGGMHVEVRGQTSGVLSFHGGLQR